MNERKPASRTNELDAPSSALNSVLQSAMTYEQPHYETVAQAQSELEQLRQRVVADDYVISQHISGNVGDMFDSEGLFVETTPSTVLVDRMVKEIKELREKVAEMEAEREELAAELAKFTSLLNFNPYQHYPNSAIFHENDGGSVTIGDMRHAAALIKRVKQS